MLSDKTVVLGVCGGIAAYKIANLASMLVKTGCDVRVIMTENATNFINPITFETLTGNKCVVDTFDRNFEFKVSHVSLAQKADVMLIAPATANVIGKVANGIADDMLTTTAMACKAPIIFAPAMNTAMYESPANTANLLRLRDYGYTVIEPDSGYLACGDSGKGKLPSEQLLFDFVMREIACEKDLAGKKVLVTAGATCEPIDPVRYITNHSSGKMGYAIAENAMLRGAEVTLISGKCSIAPPNFVNVIDTVTANDMFEAVKDYAPEQDIIVKAAAVADYTPRSVSGQKIKKSSEMLDIELTATTDILAYLGATKRDGQFLCGFAMETENLIENASAKLVRKNADMIVANNLFTEGAGFTGDTNVVTLITRDGITKLPKMSKKELAEKILDKSIADME